jgi:hypothetical protein
MSDYGAKVSQTGFDVLSAADIDLLFSSTWPLLKIEHTDTATYNRGTSGVIYTHTLGYVPFFVTFRLDSGQVRLNNDPVLYSNSTEIGCLGGAGSASVTIRYYVCRLDLKTNFTASIVESTSSTVGIDVADYGIKVTKPTKDITSTDLRDYTVHSGTRSPMIHVVKYGQLVSSGGGNFDLTYTNNLSYRPIFFAFHSADNAKFHPLTGYEQAPPKLFANSSDTNLTIRDISATYGSFVVFKDPFSVSAAENVTI